MNSKIILFVFIVFLNTFVASFLIASSTPNVSRNKNDLKELTPAPLGSATVVAWQDLNEDGIRQPAEIGIKGIILQLYNEFSNLIANGTTDDFGNYVFIGIPSGKYRVKFIKPTTLNFTFQNIGNDENLDSDVDFSGYSDFFIVTSPSYSIQITSGYKGNLQVFLGNNVSTCNGKDVELTANSYFGKPNFKYVWSTGDTIQSISVAPAITTSYFVTVTDSWGFSAIGQTTVKVKNGVGEEKFLIIDDFNSGSYPSNLYQKVDPVNQGPYNLVDSSPLILGNYRNVYIQYISGTKPAGVQIDYSTGYFAHSNDVGTISRSKLCYNANGNGLNIDITNFDYFKFKDFAIDQGEIELTINVKDNNNNLAWTNLKLPGLGNSVTYDKEIFFNTLTNINNIDLTSIKEFCFEFNTDDSSIDFSMGDIELDKLTDCKIMPFAHDVAICKGDSALIGATLDCAPSLPFFWDHDLGYGKSFKVSPPSTTIYHVTVIDAYACISTDTVKVTVYDNPIVSVNSNYEICYADSLLILPNTSGGKPPYQFIWNNGMTTSSIKIAPKQDTIVTVYILDANNCKSSIQSIYVKVFPKPVLNTFTTIADCAEKNGSATVEATGALAPYNYLWETGSTSATLLNVGAGNYSVTVTDSNGCSEHTIATVSEKDCGLIGNFVWEDLNYNGMQDNGESGVGNVKVILFDGSKTPKDSVFTDEHGFYYFYSLKEGTYYVKFVLPIGFFYTKQNLGNDIIDSDVSMIDGFTPLINLAKYQKDSTYDAGIYTYASIGDKVWEDKNGNGVQDTGENGISNVTVQLLDCNDNILNTTTTDAGGNYLFGNLIPGYYKIKFILSGNYKFTGKDIGTDDALDSDADLLTGKTVCEQLTSGENNTTYDAGVYIPTKIGDYVWEDLNANGIQEVGEPGIGNVTVTLYDCANNFIATTVTNSNGYYLFDNLKPGNYKIAITKPTGYYYSPFNVGNDASDSDIDATGYTACEALESGESNLTYDVGLYKKAEIGDRVWIDKNGDGIQNSGENGITNVEVRLETCAGVLLNTTYTNSTGNYLFTNLDPSDYRIKFILPATYHFTKKDNTSDNNDSDADQITGITSCEALTSGESNLTYDAGIYQYCSIGDKVWLDSNGNGVQDAGEAGFANVTVILQDCNGNTINSQITNINGNYLFTNLVPADYLLKFIPPTGYNITISNIGDDNTDSDADHNTGLTICESLESGENNLSYDAGIYTYASIGDKVWEDKNGNGIQDTGENGISNITVQLLDCNDNILNTTTTDAGGNYLFGNLIPGYYKIKFILSGNYKFTGKDIGTDDALDSDADLLTGKTVCEQLTSGENNTTYDAGVYIPTKIGDYVWEDLNANGIQEVGEPGIGNVTVTLYDCANNFIATTVTNSNGYYLFDNLKPGNYKIAITKPTGYYYSPYNVGNDASDSDIDGTGYTACEALESGESNLTYDVGLYKKAEIGDRVWIDKNGDGIQNSGENGITNVEVRLETCAGVLLNTTYTNSTGNYLFTNLDPSDYRIKFILPATYHFTKKDNTSDNNDSDADQITGITSCEALTSGESNLTYDAGIYQYCSIGDKVWLDSNGNGVQDAGEAGFANVTVILQDCNGITISSQQTNASGNYLFVNLVPGEYKIKFISPTNYSLTYDNIGNDNTDSDAAQNTGLTICESLESGENNLSYDAGLLYFGSLGDYVWEDLNGDGIQQSNEPGVANVTVKLFQKINNIFTQVKTTTTNSQGYYLFDKIPPSDYYIMINLPAGYYITLPNTGNDDSKDSDADNTFGNNTTKTIVLDPGENDMSWDFGIYRCAHIGDLIWNDVVRDNIYNITEGGIDGVLIKLWRKTGSSWQLWDNTYSTYNPNSTCGSGFYSFCTNPGEYYVEFAGMTPTEYNHVSPNVGSNDNIDSDINDSHGINTTESFVVVSGSNITNLDGGFFKPHNVIGTAWVDSNTNGLQDANEAKLSFITVYLYNATQLYATALTDASGNYSFNDIPAGIYYLRFTLPGSYIFTNPNVGTNDAIDSDVTHENGQNTTAWFTVDNLINYDFDAGYRIATSGLEFNPLKGKNMNSYNELKWSSKNDQLVENYEIMRDNEDSGFFEMISSMVSKKSDLSEYNYHDYNISQFGEYKYKVKAISNQSVLYSNEITIDINIGAQLQLFPNPVQDELNVLFVNTVEDDIYYQITDINGSILIKSDKIHVNKGQISEFKVETLGKLNSGIYQFVIITSKGIIKNKFIKIVM